MKFIKAKDGVIHDVAGGIGDPREFESLFKGGFTVTLDTRCGTFVNVYKITDRAVTCLVCLAKTE